MVGNLARIHVGWKTPFFERSNNWYCFKVGMKSRRSLVCQKPTHWLHKRDSSQILKNERMIFVKKHKSTCHQSWLRIWIVVQYSKPEFSFSQLPFLFPCKASPLFSLSLCFATLAWDYWFKVKPIVLHSSKYNVCSYNCIP